MNTFDLGKICYQYEGEQCLGEQSYKTPPLSTPDTCVTSTLTCKSDARELLQGDFLSEKCKEPLQLTLAMIKPDGMPHLHEIQRIIRQNGFDIVQSRRVHLSPEQASDFYYEHFGKPFFPLLITTMCEGPVQIYVLRRKDAVAMWKHICGPTCPVEAKKKWPESLRALFGTPGNSAKNVCHASGCEAKANEEIRFFFPNLILEGNYQDKLEVEDYIRDWVNPTLLEGLVQLCKNKPLNPVLWLATWLLNNNPFKPKMSEKIAFIPT